MQMQQLKKVECVNKAFAGFEINSETGPNLNAKNCLQKCLDL